MGAASNLLLLHIDALCLHFGYVPRRKVLFSNVKRSLT